MSFDYSIKPCSSAKPVKDSSGNVIQPVRYNGVGCPAVLLNNNSLLCSNGDTFNPVTGKAGVSPNDYTNDPFVGNLTNVFNTIAFKVGQIVYIEDILGTLRSIFDEQTVQLFLMWNNDLVNELLLQSGGCNGTSKTNLKGRIVAITGDIFGDGRIWWDAPLYRNRTNYPNKWPTEIFWLELFNGDDIGLQNFSIGKKLRNGIYYQELKSGPEECELSQIAPYGTKYCGKDPSRGNSSNYKWEDRIKVDDLHNFNGRQLYPVLRSQITNLQTRMLVQGTNAINRSQIMNTPRFRSRGSCTTGSLCLDTTLTPGFKNSTKNMYLAPIPYAQRLGNTFRSSQIRGTKKIVRKNCVDPQFGRLVGTGGTRLVNKF